GLGRALPRQGATELAMTERLEIEINGGGRRPETQRVDRLAAVAHHGSIERNTDQRRGQPRNGTQLAVSELDRTVHPDFDLVSRANDLPGVGAAKPVVGVLVLPPVHDGLPEHAV